MLRSSPMSEKLEAIIKIEIGADDGREMPKVRDRLGHRPDGYL